MVIHKSEEERRGERADEGKTVEGKKGGRGKTGSRGQWGPRERRRRRKGAMKDWARVEKPWRKIGRGRIDSKDKKKTERQIKRMGWGEERGGMGAG